MRPLLPFVSLAIAAILTAAPAGGQSRNVRPKLAAAADTNSWESYYDAGVDRLRLNQPHAAEEYFYWAARLDPQRAEPLFARWVAFHLGDRRRWEDYLADKRSVLTDSEVVRHDRLRYAAALRNPFVPETLEMYLFISQDGVFGHDAYTRGWIAYAGNDFHVALSAFGDVGRRDEGLYRSARHMRTELFVNLRQYDSASAELTALRALIDRHERDRLVREYESREMLEYARGLLFAVRGMPDSARATLQAAVVENVAFYPAHLWLGDLALNDGDAAAAVAEYEQAVALEPADPVLQYHYGIALAGVGRYAESTTVLRSATGLAPDYASPYLQLGQTLELAGDTTAARAAYGSYVARAPRGSAAAVAKARERLAALGTR